MLARRAVQLQKCIGASVTAATSCAAPVLAAFSTTAAPAEASEPVQKLVYKEQIRPYQRVNANKKLEGLPKSLSAVPLPGAGHVDTQGPAESRDEGVYKFDNFRFHEPYYAQRAAIGPTVPLPSKVNSTARDTLHTYSQRVYKASLRTMRSMYIQQTKHRERIVRQIAEHEFRIIQAKKEQYRAWKASQKSHDHEKLAEHLAKRASERLAGLKRGAKQRAAVEKKVLAAQAEKTSLLLEESEFWVRDPMDIKNAMFEVVPSVPTGWWPSPKYSVDPEQPGFDDRTHITQGDLDYLRSRGHEYPQFKGDTGAAARKESAFPGEREFLTNSEDETAHLERQPLAFAERAVPSAEFVDTVPEGTKVY